MRGFGYEVLINDPPTLRRNPLPPQPDDDLYSGSETVPGNVPGETTAADVRNVAELQARIKAAGGALRTNPNSSDYLVAVNNQLRFSVARQADGSFLITEFSWYWLAIWAAALIGLAVIAKR